RLSARDGRTVVRALAEARRRRTLTLTRRTTSEAVFGREEIRMRSATGRAACLPPRGVTLIELLVVIAISAILLAVGVPMMTTFVDRNRVATQVNELIADIALTRSEALARRARVILCRGTEASGCDTAGTDWGGGWRSE